MTPRTVKREDVDSLERQIEYFTGIRLPVGEEMQGRGIWVIEDD